MREKTLQDIESKKRRKVMAKLLADLKAEPRATDERDVFKIAEGATAFSKDDFFRAVKHDFVLSEEAKEIPDEVLEGIWDTAQQSKKFWRKIDDKARTIK